MNKQRNTAADITDNLRKMSQLSLDFFSQSLESNLKLADSMGKTLESMGVKLPRVKTKEESCCCPPEESCPPHCLLEINREAHPGECILVPFVVRNTCGAAKRYLIGVRPMVDQDGNNAPTQPVLNKTEVTLQPNQAETVTMSINLMQGYKAGQEFQAEVVLREKEVNQNICFNLRIKPFFDIPEARPRDEKEYFLHWQSWKSHFYCEDKRGRTARLQVSRLEPVLTQTTSEQVEPPK